MAGRTTTTRQIIEDPSANVILLVGNATKYLEDLHKQSQDFLCQKIQLSIDASQRERSAEAARIDSRWAVDNEAIKVANQVSIKQTETLATQMLDNAEVLRKAVDETAKQLAIQLQQITSSLDSRLKIVEEKQYSIAGASKGSRDMWGYVFGAVMLIIAVISFFMKW